MLTKCFFQQCTDGTYRTSPSNILKAYHYLHGHPSREIFTGMWTHPQWDWPAFHSWWRSQILKKCNSNTTVSRHSGVEYQGALKHDARIIRDTAKGIRWSGANVLNVPELQRRFPTINNPVD